LFDFAGLTRARRPGSARFTTWHLRTLKLEMDPSPQNLATLASLLQQTLSNDVNTRKTAEQTLAGVETTQGFPICLLVLLKSDGNVPAVVQSASVVYFKNLVKKHWPQVRMACDVFNCS